MIWILGTRREDSSDEERAVVRSVVSRVVLSACADIRYDRYETNIEMTSITDEVWLCCVDTAVTWKGRSLKHPFVTGGWGHEVAQAKKRRELDAQNTYAAEGGLGRDGANVPTGATGDGKRCPTCLKTGYLLTGIDTT